MRVGIRVSCPYTDYESPNTRRESEHSPRLDHFANLRGLVDFTIVHDNYGICSRKWLHFLEELADEQCEQFGIERTLHNHAFENPVERDPGKDGIPAIRVNSRTVTSDRDIPFSPSKILFPTSPQPFESPCAIPQICSAVASTFVHEYQLFRQVVASNCKSILGANILVPLQGLLGDLSKSEKDL